MYIREPIMKDVSISELRQQLPTYLARVERGERLRVTNRGRAIAEISPPSQPAEAAVQARARLAGSVLRFDRPTEPVLDPSKWDRER
jgi:prevent-host-death family protein